MGIQILIHGCYNCIKLETLIMEVLKELGKREVEVIQVSDGKQIKKMPLHLMPGLRNDGWQVNKKSVPDQETLKNG